MGLDWGFGVLWRREGSKRPELGHAMKEDGRMRLVEA